MYAHTYEIYDFLSLRGESNNMIHTSFSLNGAWDMFYQKDKYESVEPPVLKSAYYEPDPQVIDAVPGYWEDMTEQFKMATYFGQLRVNPEYGLQEYPIFATAPDMALPNVVGNFFYKRTVICEEVAENAVLYFGGVQNSVSVWINDVYIGKHEGYSTPFEMEIPSETLKKGNNSVVLSVSNFRLKGYKDRPVVGLTSRAANECTGGITGDVELRFYKSPLRDVCLYVSDDCKVVTAKADMKESALIKWEVIDEGKVLKSGEANGDFSFDTHGLECWSPEKPKLYTLCVACGEGKSFIKFGVRKLIADGVHFKLNGKPYFLRGICEHCYFPETVHPNHDIVYYRSIIKNIKKLGFNFIRFHTYIPEEEYMQAADELGVILHVESPNNTTLEEWKQIVKFCRKHPSVLIYCCGNELPIDDEFITHLEKCAKVVHDNTDGIFSPLSAMLFAEYGWWDTTKPLEKDVKAEPFKHDPEKIDMLGKFSDMYSSYANGLLSYFSLNESHKTLDEWSEVYNKPRVSHEICIDGTYTDLSLKDRYKNLRIGKTEMFTSIEKHLEEKGVLKKAPLYFKNSSEWQRRIRKHTFEKARLCNNLAGFDFLGPIDTHWHTFGYDVGMMNEFYELKPGETIDNVLMYNSPTVVIADLNKKYNYSAKEKIVIPIYVSHYGENDIVNGEIAVRLFCQNKVLHYEKIPCEFIQNGVSEKVCDCKVEMPEVCEPLNLKLKITLSGNEVYAENEWELYVFPKNDKEQKENIVVSDTKEIEELVKMLKEGKDVLLIGGGPFSSKPTTFRISLAGRTEGNLATVINDHPALGSLPHEGFCNWQFAELLDGGNAIIFEAEGIPFEPIIEVVSSHKCVFKQAALVEFNALNGRLLIAGFNFKENSPASSWLFNQLISYMEGTKFNPKHTISEDGLITLSKWQPRRIESNTNFAFNANDKSTMQ